MLRKKAVEKIKNINSKYKKVIIFIFVLLVMWFFGLGVLGGWLLTKGGMEKFPEIGSSDRLLIISPHIDDETICCGGLIQRALKNGAEIKIIYVTNGDDNLASVISKDRNYNPDDFIQLGEERMSEASKSALLLGLKPENLIFLGYPDRGINAMYSKNYSTPYVALGTRLSYNPYPGTYESQQDYTGTNLFNDLASVIGNFRPTIVITSNPRDKNTDHKAVYSFVDKIRSDLDFNFETYTFLVHYTLYPPNKRLQMNQFLYPPRTLFTKSGWYSFDLTLSEESVKLKAVDQNKTQMTLSRVDDLLESFVKRNEIFEKLE